MSGSLGRPSAQPPYFCDPRSPWQRESSENTASCGGTFPTAPICPSIPRTSDLVVGLFVIGLLCALPESLAAWRLAREGKTTTAVSTAMADGIVSLTVALVPPALAGATVGDIPLQLTEPTNP